MDEVERKHQVFCDNRMQLRLKGRFNKVVVKPVMLYGSECWAVDIKTEQKMRILR